MITIINYGMGNLGSVQNMLKRIGAACKISSDPKEIEAADKILLPGVGAFDAAVKKIDELNSYENISFEKSNLEDKVKIYMHIQCLIKESELELFDE